MFSYYGSKSKLVNYYPRPVFGKIIEPFAGSARYSLKYFDRDVLLVDKYEIIIRIWKYLQQCSASDIMGLPNLKAGYKIKREDFDCIEQAWLMGFIIKRVQKTPGLTVSTWGETEILRSKKRIAQQLFKIRHWKFIYGDYSVIPNQEGTWFIDPPYEIQGVSYRHGSKSIDFGHLGTWSRERIGQVIVCENSQAKWLPFVEMKNMNGLKRSSIDSIWSNMETNYDFVQKKMFK